MTEQIVSPCYLSEPASANAALQSLLERRSDLLKSIPAIPAVLNTLLSELSQPPEDVDLVRVAELIGRDGPLAGQCLRMANSALLGARKPTDSIRGAVRTLGIGHTREVAVSTALMRMGSAQKTVNPVVFWEHSLACAILSRKLARSVAYEDSDKAYLAGLLHDLGFIVNLVLLPEETKRVMEKAASQGTFLGKIEYEDLGFTHCQSGEALARFWNFSEDIIEVIRFHHNPAEASAYKVLVTIVALADRLSRSADMGLGYRETPDPASQWQNEWTLLVEQCPQAALMKWSDFVKDAGPYLADVRELVKAMYAS